MKLLRASRAWRRAPRSCRPPSLHLAINGRIDVQSKFHDARRVTAVTRMRIGLRGHVPASAQPNHATQWLSDAKPMHTSTARRKRLNDRQPGTKIFLRDRRGFARANPNRIPNATSARVAIRVLAVESQVTQDRSVVRGAGMFLLTGWRHDAAIRDDCTINDLRFRSARRSRRDRAAHPVRPHCRLSPRTTSHRRKRPR